MFTGIIHSLATVTGADTSPRAYGTGQLAYRLQIELGPLVERLALGASVAINGVCLTLADRRGHVGAFDVIPETWQRTALPQVRAGDRVHIEPSLRVGDTLDGHFVQGHVDGIGVIQRVDRPAGEWKLWVRTETDLLRAIVPKGSIAIDGVSLTVVDATAEAFSVALVPTTLERTTFAQRQPGDPVNVETDILARIVMRQLGQLGLAPAAGEASGLTLEQLRLGGYVQ